MRRLITATVFGFALVASPVFAAEPAPTTSLLAAGEAAMASTDGPQANFRLNVEARVRRPSMLPMLYLTSGALQGYDAYSTLTALKAGGVEANPLMKSLTKNPAAFVAMKAGMATMSIMAAENMWKHGHRAAAIGVMVVSNVAMGYVAANNARVLSTLK